MSLNCNQAAQVVTPGIAVFTWDYSQMASTQPDHMGFGAAKCDGMLGSDCKM